MRINIITTQGLHEVECQPGFEMFGFTFVTHIETEATKWGPFTGYAVTELSTGRRLFGDLDREEAIERAKAYLERKGEAVLKVTIERYEVINQVEV